MKKKVLLKSVAAVMSLVTLAPYFLGVAQVEAGHNKLYNLSNPEGEQRSQYKRQRCSNEEDVTGQNLHKNPKLDICNLLNHEEGSTNETQFKLPSLESVLESSSLEEKQCGQYKCQRCSNEEIENEEDGIVSNQCKRRKTKTNPEEVGKYIVEKEATYEKAVGHFGVASTTIRNRVNELKNINLKLFEKVKEIYCRNKVYFKKDPKAVGRYIVENRATRKQAAEHFGVSEQTIYKYINKLSKDNLLLYEEVKEVGRGSKRCVKNKDINPKDVTPEIIGAYIVENNATYEQAAEYFRISTKSVQVYLYELKQCQLSSNYIKIIKSRGKAI